MAVAEDMPDVRRFELLASALAGREVRVAPGPVGEPSWTDGATVFIDDTAPDPDQLRAVAVQACLIAHDSLQPEMMRRLVRHPKLARRYLAVEGARALWSSRDLLPTAVRTLGVETPGTAGPTESLALAARDREQPAAPVCFGVLQPQKVLARSRSAAAAGQSQDHGQAAQNRHRPRRNDPAELSELDDEEITPDGSDPFSSPVGGGGALGRLLQRMLGAVRQLGDGGTPGADTATHRARNGGRTTGAVVSTVTAGFSDDGDGAAHPGWKYPEWDVAKRRYRPDWCTVQEIEPERVDEVFPLADRHSLRRPLTRLGIGLDRCHRQAQGNDVDIDAVVEARVELAAGTPPEERLYLDSLRRRRDLAVLVLLDVSGSAGEPGTAGRTVHEQQVSAAATLAAALHELGDRVALYAYCSQGRSAVSMIPVKRFGEQWGIQNMQRLSGLRPGAYSRLGAAIRHGTAVVAEQGATSRQLLVVISDGLAYDHGYERTHGAADARRALAEARRKGVGCLCLTVGAATADSDVRLVFGSAAHAAVPRPAQVGDVIGPLFRAALRSADLRRRIS